MHVTLDHVGIVVSDFAGLETALGAVLGLPVGPPEAEPATAMEVLWVPVGDTQLQFIRPTRSDTGAAAVLDQRGPGVHHIGLRVDDVADTLHELRRIGIRTRDQNPRAGARGARVGFVHPDEVAGTEIEFVEHP